MRNSFGQNELKFARKHEMQQHIHSKPNTDITHSKLWVEKTPIKILFVFSCCIWMDKSAGFYVQFMYSYRLQPTIMYPCAWTGVSLNGLRLCEETKWKSKLQYWKYNDVRILLEILYYIWVKCHWSKIANKNKRYKIWSENETSRVVLRNRILFIICITLMFSWNMFHWISRASCWAVEPI